MFCSARSPSACSIKTNFLPFQVSTINDQEGACGMEGMNKTRAACHVNQGSNVKEIGEKKEKLTLQKAL
jgi:hypothetical protein